MHTFTSNTLPYQMKFSLLMQNPEVDFDKPLGSQKCVYCKDRIINLPLSYVFCNLPHPHSKRIFNKPVNCHFSRHFEEPLRPQG